MDKIILDRVQPKGIVERRLIDTRKLFELAKEHGLEYAVDFETFVATNKSASLRVLSLALAQALGNETTAKLIDKAAKKQFADNFIWRFLKKQFSVDFQIPYLTGVYTTNAIARTNLIVNTGHKRYADQIGGTTATPMTALAIGTSGTAPAATDTTLTAEITTNGGARAAATISNVTTSTTGDTEQWVKTWTFTGSFAIQEEGILDNNVSGGTLAAHNTFTTVNVASGDSFQITHKIQS